MPLLMVPQNDLPIGADDPFNGNPGVIASSPSQNNHLSTPTDSNLLPPTPASAEGTSAQTDAPDGIGDMWRSINDRSGNISKTEKIINKINDTTSATVNAESSTDSVVGFVKNVIANDTIKAVGNTILEDVPGIMGTLEALTEVHPFLKAAYLPFQLIYHQETQRRDNDHKRTTLFGKIKDVMLVLLELKDFKKDDTHKTPDNKPVLSRLASLCKDMRKDIEECYNVLNAQEKRSIAIKFLKAGAWNKELGAYASRFANRREELTFALSMRTAVTIEEMNSNMKIMMEMFATMLTPQERDMGRWIHYNGGEEAVLGDHRKCAAMIKYGASLVANSGIGHVDKGRPGAEDNAKKQKKAIAALWKEYREDIGIIIRKNWESYSKRFEMGLDDLGKDLGNKIRHQGDHVIEYLRGDPHKDKIIYQVSSAQTDAMDSMGDIWRDINDRSGNTSETEKIINKISDTTSAVVNAASSTDGVVGFAKDVIANDTIKAVVNTFLEGIPTLMSALETLSEIHPFLKVAYLPFKLIYYQYAIRMPFAQFPNLFRETQRRDNDQRRTTLFGKIKDVMVVLLELKDFKKDDTRQTPDKKPVLGRLASLCKDMKKDIEECYNVLNAQEKRSLAIKFLKAAAWNKELGVYASRFTNRRDELMFALSLRTAVTIEEINSNMKTMMKMFATMLTPRERDMELWISRNGGEKGVLGDDKKCAAMIKYEASLAASSSVSHVDKGRPGADEDARKEEKAIAALRKEYREDIGSIIEENLESYSKRFEMGLDELGKDLGNKIEHEADRLARIFRGGPHQRIEDKMIYHVWKDQGWKGSAKTWPLILALRDYFVERIKHGQLLQTSTDVRQNRHPVSTVPQKDDDDNDDPEIDISVALPDSWMVSYLQVKHLRYLEQAIDPDASGFTTISEINAFTRARPEDWSLPHWISYWAIGWQIYATKYCVEIEELFNQMHLLKLEMAVKMPGNTRYVNDYIEGCWQHVTALTSSIERYSGGELRLEEKFSPYIESQEAILKERLGKIQYDIDAIETVSLVLRGDRVEGSIFILLALLMRRHLAKMHLGLTQELDSRELWDDVDTITEVADAVWIRFVDLKEQFQLREAADLKPVFEWFSCGLFKNYWQWDNWLQTEHFMENDMKAWTGDTIRELDPSELVGILAYTDTPGPKANEPSDTTTSDSVAIESATGEGTPITDPESAVRTVEALSADQITPAGLNSSTKPSEAEMSITGTWYGFHWTKTQKPFLAMVAFNVKCSEREPESDIETEISGDGFGANGNSFALSGTMNSAGDQPAGSFSLNFQHTYEDGTWVQYNGTFNPDHETMTGTFERAIASGSCLFKKVPTSAIMCARPLVPELNAKELWSFALNAVLNEIRRKKPSLSYIRERMIDIRQTMAFMHRDNDDLLTEPEEQAQYSKLLMKFSVEESVELNKLYQWYARSGDLQPAGYSCDGCGSSLVRSRIVCLGCVSTDYPERTVDFCSKPECVATESIPQRTDVEHHPDHMMVRFRDLLLLKDYFEIKQRAGYTLDWARSIYKDPTEESSLTMPLPESPVAAGDSTEVAKDNSNGETDVTIVDDAPTPTPIPISSQIKSAPQLGLPALDTTVSDPQPLASDPGTPSSDGLLSAAVTPVEDQTLNCEICHERIVAPCWSCVTCYGSTWVCDACEKATDELLPWDYQNRYRAEVETMGGRDDGSSHTVFHALVRFVCPKSDSTSSETNSKTTHTAADPATPAHPSSNSSWDQIEKRIEELVTAGFEAVNTRFEAVNSHVDKRLDEVEAKLESRLVNIERLLNLLVAAGQPKSQS